MWSRTTASVPVRFAGPGLIWSLDVARTVGGKTLATMPHIHKYNPGRAQPLRAPWVHSAGATSLNTETFKDTYQALDEALAARTKAEPVYMFCTGGIGV